MEVVIKSNSLGILILFVLE